MDYALSKSVLPYRGSLIKAMDPGIQQGFLNTDRIIGGGVDIVRWILRSTAVTQHRIVFRGVVRLAAVWVSIGLC